MLKTLFTAAAIATTLHACKTKTLLENGKQNFLTALLQVPFLSLTTNMKVIPMTGW